MDAIVTGSFDPMTIGHYEIIKQASKIFDRVFVVALVNANKAHMFTLEERKKIIELSTKEFENVVADAYDGLTADYMHENGITQIVRGIKNEQEIEYEEKLAKTMSEYDANFKTTFFKCDKRLENISSTLVRNMLKSNKSIKEYVHYNAFNAIVQMYQNKVK